jgi:hypothetical protein
MGKGNIPDDHKSICAKYDDTKGNREWYPKCPFSSPLKKSPTAIQSVNYVCFEMDQGSIIMRVILPSNRRVTIIMARNTVYWEINL